MSASLVGSEMCIRDSMRGTGTHAWTCMRTHAQVRKARAGTPRTPWASLQVRKQQASCNTQHARDVARNA
eukprot:8561549-Alexandrium_andersonii.AAC.1